MKAGMQYNSEITMMAKWERYSSRAFLMLSLLLMNGVVYAMKTYPSFSFYGKEVRVPVDGVMRDQVFRIPPVVSEDFLLGQRKVMDKLELDSTGMALSKHAEELQLDGVGHFMLIKAFAQEVLKKQPEEAKNLVIWYLLRKSKYDALLAYAGNKIHVFIHFGFISDGAYGMNKNGKRYTSVGFTRNPGSSFVVTEGGMWGYAQQPVNFDGSLVPQIGSISTFRYRSLQDGNYTYQMQVPINEERVKYYNDLPIFRLGAYLMQSNPDRQTLRVLDDSFEQWMVGMGESQKLRFILKWCQEAFEYQADRNYLGKEKRNRVEQTLAETYSDCEDRAVLLTWMVQRYLHKNTLMIYDEKASHVFAAVEMPANAVGYNFKFENKKWQIFEASYKGYLPGETDFAVSRLGNVEVIKNY